MRRWPKCNREISLYRIFSSEKLYFNYPFYTKFNSLIPGFLLLFNVILIIKLWILTNLTSVSNSARLMYWYDIGTHAKPIHYNVVYLHPLTIICIYTSTPLELDTLLTTALRADCVLNHADGLHLHLTFMWFTLYFTHLYLLYALYMWTHESLWLTEVNNFF